MLTVLQTALEVGLIYGLVALALFISFSILNIADLSTDGCFTLGCAVGAMLTIKKKFGKNAILKGMNLEEGATAKDRNAQIGGHKA